MLSGLKARGWTIGWCVALTACTLSPLPTLATSTTTSLTTSPTTSSTTSPTTSSLSNSAVDAETISEKPSHPDITRSGAMMKNPVGNAELTQLYADIKQMVGAAEATELAQCRKVGLGYRACGGPASYLIYSVQGLNEASLLEKVSRYNRLSQVESERLGLMSTCQIIEEPTVTLVAGVCQAKLVDSGDANSYE